MARNYQAWRNAVRSRWNSGKSNPEYVGPWANISGIYRLPTDGRFVLSWPFFGRRQNNITVSQEEVYNRTYSYTLNYEGGSPPPYTRTRTQAYTLDLAANVPRANIRLYGVVPEPAPSALIRHTSACAFGDGLYDAMGSIIVFAEETTTEIKTDTEPFGDNSSDTETKTTSVEFRYRSDQNNLNGRLTECLVTAQQRYHGPAYAFALFDPESPPFLPFETDEYGVTSDTSVEVYHTHTFLVNLITGTFSENTVRNSGSVGYGDTFPDPDPGDLSSYSVTDDWSRSGNLTLTMS